MSEMLQIVVASQNPVKIEATRQGFAKVFPAMSLDVSGCDVPSGVSEQPMGNVETMNGARNRADNAQKAHPDADYWVGIEGGVEELEGSLQAFAWVVVQSAEKRGRGKTGTFVLPDEVVQLMQQGMELGHADDVVFGRSNSKQENGSVGILTGDVINRMTFYAPAVVLALIPFIHPELTFKR